MSRRNSRLVLILLCVVAFGTTGGPATLASGQDDSWYERKAEWNGFDQFHFQVAARPAYVVAPESPLEGNPWVWRARFPGYHAEMDVTLLERGFHVGYVDVAGMFGSPKAMEIGDAFHEYVTTQLKLANRPALEGVSRGGLFVYNWAVRHPDRVSCIYCDTPVCDFKSWPAGQGTGLGSQQAWAQCLAAYGFDESQANAFEGNPVDQAAIIASARIPLLHIVSENDEVVPPGENTYRLRDRLLEHDHPLEVISVKEGTERSNGHHFDHPQPRRVVEFIVENASYQHKDRQELLRNAGRIVFLGDSITYAGHYVAYFDAWMQTLELEQPPVVIDVGLPSETVSGLSEDGHAGGRFPRPDLAERLDRVLEATKPDLVFACYGINCGIYQPFAEDRFSKYQTGFRRLKDKVEAAGATLIVVTPPFYDDQKAKRDFSYNEVLDRYSEWLVEEFGASGDVIDLHSAMTREVRRRREADAEFTFQPDAVHPNNEGHWFIATELMRWFGDNEAADAENVEAMLQASDLPAESFSIVRERLNVRRDAYLSAAGHKRPGIRQGLPLEEAEQRAKALTEQLAD